MITKTLFFDEAGFTGYNLLDRDQPIFVIASTDIPDDAAKRILMTSFPRYRGAEFKFTNIWGSSNRAGFINFARELGSMSTRAFIWAIDKRFGVLTKIVDFLIEPYITDAGYDFYADGFCWKYANYIYYGLTELADPQLFDSLTGAYQIFSRDPSIERLEALQIQLEIMANSADEEVRIFLEQTALGAALFMRHNHLPTFKGTNELQTTSMLASVAHWRQRHGEDFTVVHDQSSNFFRRRDTWEKITGPDVPHGQLKLGDGSSVEFPLRVVSTTPADSKSSHAIQLCDVLAGLATRGLDRRLSEDDRTFMVEVLGAGFGKMVSNGIRASSTFPDQIPPRRLSGPDAVDRFNDLVFRERS